MKYKLHYHKHKQNSQNVQTTLSKTQEQHLTIYMNNTLKHLVTAKVDLDTIHLVGSWWSNTMICYLHITANSFTKGLTVKMYQHGSYALISPVHAGNKCQAELRVPHAPNPKIFLGSYHIISVVLENKYHLLAYSSLLQSQQLYRPQCRRCSGGQTLEPQYLRTGGHTNAGGSIHIQKHINEHSDSSSGPKGPDFIVLFMATPTP